MPTLEATQPNVINLNHLVPPILEPRPIRREATEEELEELRLAREEVARGEFFAQKPGETIEAFVERILADPENNLVCHMK